MIPISLITQYSFEHQAKLNVEVIVWYFMWMMCMDDRSYIVVDNNKKEMLLYLSYLI